MDDFKSLPFVNDEMAPPAPGAGDYEEFRRRYGLEVPGLLRELLELRNGGRVQQLWVTSRNAALQPGLQVSRFLFLKLDDFSPEGMVGCFRGWRDAMGPQGLSFALDAAGNVFFVDLSADPAPVKYARQQREIEVFTVSPDLAKFLAELHTGDEPRDAGWLYLYDGPVKREDVPPSPVAASKKWGCCSWRMLVAGFLLFLFLDWWTRRTLWEDGDFKVYGKGVLVSSDDWGNKRVLDEQIVAMGSNDRYLVIQQWRDGTLHFYILDKKSFSLVEISAGVPYTKEEFERRKAYMDLPPFTWHNRWVFYPKEE